MSNSNTLRATLWLSIGLALLNLALTFHNLWPTVWVRPVRELSLDLTVGLLLLALYQEFTRRTPGRRLQVLLSVLLLLFILGRYIQVTAPALFGRKLNLYWDLAYIPDVAAMTAAARPLWFNVVLTLGLSLALLLIIALLSVLVRRITLALNNVCCRRALLAVTAAGLMVYGAGRLSAQLNTEHWFSTSVAGMYSEQIGFVLHAQLAEQRLPPPPAELDVDLSGLNGNDVYLIFLESYGAVVRDRRVFSEPLRPVYDELAAAAHESGWYAASAWMYSSTFGGASWLAHSSVMSGSRIDSQEVYRLLISSDRKTLVKRFQAAGYRCVALMPGLKKAWPEGDFYGFDAIYPAADLDYAGPAFGWWEIPDQYSLDWLNHRELEHAGRQPLLVFFPTIMSHAPFAPIPPYYSDWELLRTAAPYSGEQYLESLALAQRQSDDEAYLRAVRYNLSVLSGYLRRQTAGDALLIVLGDHQPPAFISGPDASRDVPVHVFSRDGKRLRTFLDAGFQEGVRPQLPAVDGIERLHQLLLETAGKS